METVRLILTSEVDGQPIRYTVKVDKDVAEKYEQIIKESPEMEQMDALEKASS